MSRLEKNTIKPPIARACGLGQCSLDEIALTCEYPVEDTKPEADTLITEGGGPAATALVTLARLGIKSSFMGVIGDDPAGKAIKKSLSSEGISTRGLITRKDATSQRALIVVNTKTSSRTIIWKRASCKPLTAEEVRPLLIKRSSILLLDGLMQHASLGAAKIAAAAKVPILLDAGSMRAGMMELAGIADYVVASESFASAVASTPKKALKELRAINPKAKAITITLGDRGSLTCECSVTCDSKRHIRKKAYKVAAVDSTGAGDVFHGGFAYGAINGWPIEETINFASAVAALKCKEVGGRRGIPSLRQARRLMKEQAI